MNKKEIIEGLEKAKRQLAAAERMNAPESAKDLAKRKIADFEKKLEEADKAPEKKEESAPKKAAMPVKKTKEPKKEEKPKAKIPVKKEKVSKKVSAPDKKEKAKKEEKYVELDGKKYYESDKNFCEMLVRKWEGRKAAMQKANKKYKTKTISERIGGDIASAVIKTIDHVVDVKEAQIAKNPTLYIAKFEKLEDSANTFAKAIKDLLGSEYDSSEVKAELEDIEKAIDKIKSKIKK
jgi:hypothetical protein